MPTSVPNFNFLALLVSEIKRVSQNLMWGYQSPAVPRTLKLLCVLKVLGKVKQRAKFQHRISMDHAIMRICISHRFSIIWAQNGVFGGFEGEDVKYYLLTPKRHYPAWIRVCWCIAWQNRFNYGLSSRSVERFCEQRRNKKKIEWQIWLYGEK